MGTPRKIDHWPEIDLPWEQDPVAQAAVKAHPEGMTMREISDYLCVHHERIRQISETAFAKLRRQPELFRAFKRLVELHHERDRREDAPDPVKHAKTAARNRL